MSLAHFKRRFLEKVGQKSLFEGILSHFGRLLRVTDGSIPLSTQPHAAFNTASMGQKAPFPAFLSHFRASEGGLSPRDAAMSGTKILI